MQDRISKETQKLMEQAEQVYKQNFPMTTCFERALFFSWYCNVRDCAYCYMSTQPDIKTARRSIPSLLAETLLCRKLGWELGFISGGIGAFSQHNFKQLMEKISLVYGEKAWINIGPLNEKLLKDYLSYTKGVVGSIETINPKIHKKVCPSKPAEPYIKMFKKARLLGLKNAMTIILGLGETKEDFSRLEQFILEHDIEKIHFYGLNPQKGTIFEKTKSPTADYQAWWIAKTRIAFPKMDIQCGIWEDKVDRVAILLKAGANSISKFPATRRFNSKEAKEIEKQAAIAGRKFTGTLTKMPKIDWDKEVDKLKLDKELKISIKKHLTKYVSRMSSKK